MLKKLQFSILLVLILFCLTGCYDSTGIEDFYYAIAIGIDSTQNNTILLSIQTAKPNGSSDSETSQSDEAKICTVECESIDSGINILNNYLNKKINLSHCSAIVFSEKIAKTNISKYVNNLGNNTELRPDCNIIVSSEKAIDVLDKISNSGEGFSARLYESILNSVDYTGYTLDATLNDFFFKFNNNQTEAVATYVIVNEDSVQNAGIAVFKNNMMIGTISPIETIAHLLITNDLKTCNIAINNPYKENETIDLNIKRVKPTNVDVSLVNNTPFIKIEASLECSINSSGSEFDYTSHNNVRIIEHSIENYLEKTLYDYLYIISKKYNSDIIGFSRIS